MSTILWLCRRMDDSDFLVTVGEAVTLDFERSPTVLLTFAANRYTRAAARLYQDRFGIGAMDWRMLVMLTREPGSSVSHAGRTIGIDKGAVSRSLKRLEDKGLATTRGGRSDWVLTPAGEQLHAEILKVALERQQRLLEGLSAQDVAVLTRCLGRFLTNLEGMEQA
ncbi:MAG: MarR family transcriptional regulator [Pseudooceanicola sp.]|nr:MarR family transcriptional regulator [Pseudooceanicola sp.]